ncbi:MAG TPA: hypothetical protein VJQ47_15620 [Steroidobacteraceae bacterium]|nr:hypothetical protein [Steroidobacteraceae bacterium]
MSLVKLRKEIEHLLRHFTSADGLIIKRPKSSTTALQELKEYGISPPSTDQFLEVLRVMNEAVHGFDYLLEPSNDGRRHAHNIHYIL